MMTLPVHEEDYERFGVLCRLYQANFYHYLDGNVHQVCLTT
jgi:hypothetical protein